MPDDDAVQHPKFFSREGYAERFARGDSYGLLLALLVAPAAYRMHMIAAVTLLSLASLGALGGHLAGAPKVRASLRVTLGGALAMAVTAGIGHLLGVTV